jgi:hypothetical protein
VSALGTGLGEIATRRRPPAGLRPGHHAPFIALIVPGSAVYMPIMIVGNSLSMTKPGSWARVRTSGESLLQLEQVRATQLGGSLRVSLGHGVQQRPVTLLVLIAAETTS